MNNMKIEGEGHAHARSFYTSVEKKHYSTLFRDAWEVRRRKLTSLNVHLPFEVQHPARYPHLSRGLLFIDFGEHLKRIFKIPLYWENAPEQHFGVWDLVGGQTQWDHVPTHIDLTLDTGHLMLGSADIAEARKRMSTIIYDRGKQVKHLHVHENDLVHDWHWPIGRVITQPIFERLIEGRSYIFERDEVITGESPKPPYTPLI